MKPQTVELSAGAANHLKGATKHGYVLLTRGGKPIAYVLPTAFYDEEDIGYMTDPEFWAMIEERRKDTGGVPLEAIEADLAERERAEAAKRIGRKTRNGRKKAS